MEKKLRIYVNAKKWLNQLDQIEQILLKTPTSSSFNQLNFKSEYFQYGYDLTESIQLTFCSAYIEITELVEIKETGETATVKVIDLEAITSSEVFTIIIQSASTSRSDGVTLPAKNYSVTISELDKLLLAIQNNIVALLEDEEINANDYNKKEKIVKRKKKESNSDN
ncbi:hypothetical protein GLOIN_2v1844088 [Rhizophagus clarus]|uniref:Uncharacterized protein n=1 Tax=Rhizophagus clarus TaxID=94130 RepID=A0A8H3L1Z1_9GLOM|nr:hypothetical protein GLOIN_2v1844088 [Rhizophagus clarus]